MNYTKTVSNYTNTAINNQLIQTVSARDIGPMKKLLSKGSYTDYEFSRFHIICIYEYIECVKVLIKEGVDVDSLKI